MDLVDLFLTELAEMGLDSTWVFVGVSVLFIIPGAGALFAAARLVTQPATPHKPCQIASLVMLGGMVLVAGLNAIVGRL